STNGSGRLRWPWSNCAMTPRPASTSFWSFCEPDCPATKFPPISPSWTPSREHRRAKLISAPSESASPKPNMPNSAPTLAPVLRGHARGRVDHRLLVCDAERLTYADAERRSARLACGLVALGAGKGTHIGLLYPNGAAFVVAMLAA